MDTDKWHKWDKLELEKLYHRDKLTLQEIGDKFGVTRSRVQQVMHRLKIERREQRGASHKNRLGRQTRYLTLNDYLKSTINNNNRQNFASRTVKKYLPENVQCGECKNSILARKAHIHHIIYPALSVNDIQVLCPGCHALKHKGKMTYSNQLSAYTEYKSGKTLDYLMGKYKVSYSTMTLVIRKIEAGCLSLHTVATSLKGNNKNRRWLRDK